MMQQALILAENDQGTPAYEWIDIRNYQDEDGNMDPQTGNDENYAYWNKYLAPYIKCLKVEKGIYNAEDNTKSKGTKIYFADGSTAEMHLGNCVDLRFDINGDRLPNEFGRDIFVFFIATGKSYSLDKESEISKINHLRQLICPSIIQGKRHYKPVKLILTIAQLFYNMMILSSKRLSS